MLYIIYKDRHPQPSFTYFQFRNPNKESFFPTTIHVSLRKESKKAGVNLYSKN